MIEITVPCDPNPSAVASVIKFVTDGLDAVVIGQKASIEKPGHMTMTVTGNKRDLNLAEERAETLK